MPDSPVSKRRSLCSWLYGYIYNLNLTLKNPAQTWSRELFPQATEEENHDILCREKVYLFVFKNYSKSIVRWLRNTLLELFKKHSRLQDYSQVQQFETRWIKVCTLNRLFCTPYYAENCVRNAAGIISRHNFPCNNLFTYKINIRHILARIYLRELNTKWIQFREIGLL